MNIKQMLENPAGKGSSHLAARYAIIENLNNRYIKIRDKIKKGDAGIDGEVAYISLKIPSEDKNMDKLYYDVVIKFNNIHEIVSKNELQFFSNSPAFTFNYAYVFNQKNLIIPELKSLYSKQSLKDAPTIKNPEEIIGFEKSIYYAILFLKDNGFHIGYSLFTTLAKNKGFKVSKMIKELTNSNDKLAEIKSNKAEISKNNKKLKQQEVSKPKVASKLNVASTKKVGTQNLVKTQKLVSTIKPIAKTRIKT